MAGSRLQIYGLRQVRHSRCSFPHHWASAVHASSSAPLSLCLQVDSRAHSSSPAWGQRRQHVIQHPPSAPQGPDLQHGMACIPRGSPPNGDSRIGMLALHACMHACSPRGTTTTAGHAVTSQAGMMPAHRCPTAQPSTAQHSTTRARACVRAGAAALRAQCSPRGTARRSPRVPQLVQRGVPRRVAEERVGVYAHKVVVVGPHAERQGVPDSAQGRRRAGRQASGGRAARHAGRQASVWKRR